MPDFIDQTGRKIYLDKTPEKIISVVPSLTELLYDLGLDNEVAGITKFCVYPEKWFLTKTRIGGTKTLDIPHIHELHPDLVIANKEENVKEQVEELAAHYPVWISDINNLEDAYHAIGQIGDIVGKKGPAESIIHDIKRNFTRLIIPKLKPKACYLIWRNPYMTVGGGTFIHSMLEEAGFENVFKDRVRYPVVSLDDIAIRKPGWILLASEPFPFKEKHIEEMKAHLPGTKFLLADGEMFSWYGSRMIHAPSYFLNLWQYGIHGK